MPPKVRQLKADLRRAGFQEESQRGQGSHSWWIHPGVAEVRVNLSGRDGEEAMKPGEN